MAEEVATDRTAQSQAEEGAQSAPSSVPAGTGLSLVGLTKEFTGHHGERVIAVDDVDLHIDHGEYVVLLGPSGCGKTTTLRIIGGHESPTKGEVTLDGQSLIGLAPDKRPTTTVFQHFALFPHKTVLDNVEFGPKMHGVPKDERRQKAMAALDQVGLTEMYDRKPAALSGGQQQRVALARVLVMEPKALLLDEPLGDLDRLLRLKMRVELRELQRQLGIMFIHVTHDQEEALAVGDRIVVMHEGRIEQDADPLTMTRHPANELVARFMGDNNILHGTVSAQDDGRVTVDADGIQIRGPSDTARVGSSVAVSIRAGAVQVDENGRSSSQPNEAECEIVFVEYLGDLVKLHLSKGSREFLAKVPGEQYANLRGKEGQRTLISWKEADVRVLHAEDRAEAASVEGE